MLIAAAKVDNKSTIAEKASFLFLLTHNNQNDGLFKIVNCYVIRSVFSPSCS